MFQQFTRRHEIDIAMLQDVTSKYTEVKGYHVMDNISIAGREMAIIVREDLQMDRIKRIPSGRGLMAYYKKMFH